MYFFDLEPSSIDDPEFDMKSSIDAVAESGLQPSNVVFEVAESDLLRDQDHSLRIREYLRRSGFGFAMSSAGVGAGTASFRAITDFAPEYIKLDGRLVHNIERPGCAPTVCKLVQLADKSGAHVVAEAVDRVRMAENLLLLGVALMQGQLFGSPGPEVVPAP